MIPPNILNPIVREWSAFNRQFVNKTNDLKSGQQSNIIIYTKENVYSISANDYMRGKIFAKIQIDGNEELINTTLEEFRNGTIKVGKGNDFSIQNLQSDRGRGYNRHASLKETLAAEGVDELGGNKFTVDNKSNNERSRKHLQNEQLTQADSTESANFMPKDERKSLTVDSQGNTLTEVATRASQVVQSKILSRDLISDFLYFATT